VKTIKPLAPLLLLFSLGAGFKTVHSYPHDPDAFTQGLVFHDGFLYEGTGLEGRSSLRKVDLTTGRVLQHVELPPVYFGEGIVIWKDKLIQLTWRSKIGFVYDLATFKQLRTFNYSREGWGITHDGKRLIMSDGSASLFFWDPETLQETGRLPVTDNGQPVTNLNELEFIRGEIWANVWQTDRIARISPATGHVTGWVNLPSLLTEAERARTRARGDGVLNGIAYDSKSNRIFVTGKLWPKLFEIGPE
jgi:glutaminyl-peptide cyclotransferase